MVAATPRRISLWDTTPDGGIEVYPHWGQQAVLDSQRRIILMLAGTQGGKTALGPLWLLDEWQRRGQGDYLVVTPTYPLLQLKALPEFLRLWQHTLHLGEWRAGERVFHVHDGSRIIFGSASNPESLESATAKAAWLDEAGQSQFTLAAWEAIMRRLAIHQGRVLITTTPYDLGWLRVQIYARWQHGDPDIEVVQFASDTNPAFPHEEMERARATMADWRYRMFYLGQFERPPALVYGDYNDAYVEQGGLRVHDRPIPPEWPRHVGVDFGPVHTAIVIVARDASNPHNLYVCTEYMGGRKTTQEHCQWLLQHIEGCRVASWMGGAKSEEQQRADWRSHGVPLIEPPLPDVEAGIDRVLALFRAKQLHVLDRCEGLRSELGSYSREVNDETGEVTERLADKESYHRLDALRYAVQGVPYSLHGGPVTPIRYIGVR